jgi:hypothetical protein
MVLLTRFGKRAGLEKTEKDWHLHLEDKVEAEDSK